MIRSSCLFLFAFSQLLVEVIEELLNGFVWCRCFRVESGFLKHLDECQPWGLQRTAYTRILVFHIKTLKKRKQTYVIWKPIPISKLIKFQTLSLHHNLLHKCHFCTCAIVNDTNAVRNNQIRRTQQKSRRVFQLLLGQHCEFSTSWCSICHFIITKLPVVKKKTKGWRMFHKLLSTVSPSNDDPSSPLLTKSKWTVVTLEM